MRFIQGIGLGIYYRLRRMNKALRNWRKFGVIIFGGIFLLTSMVAPMQLVDTAEAADAKLTYLYIDPSTLSIEQGKTYQFAYRAEDQNHQAVTITPNWSAVNTTAGSIAQTGVFTAGQTPGTYDNAIKLSAGALSTYARVIVVNSNPVIIPPTTGKLTYLYIDPSTLSVAKGKSYQFKYRAEDQNHQPIAITPNWSVTNAMAGSIAQTGVFTAGQTPGTYNNAVKLSSGALSTYARIIVVDSGTITPPPTVTNKLTYLYIDPSTLKIAEGNSYQFKYRAEDQNHQPIAITPNWSVTNAMAGSIAQTGVFTAGQTPGTYNNAVKLSAGVLSTYARVIVYKPVTQIQLNSVTINPTAVTLNTGTQKQFTATAYDQNGAVISSGVTFYWNVTNGQAGGITQTGLFTADNHLGTFNNVVKVTATKNGISKSAYASVTVQEGTQTARLNSVVINPAYVTLQTGHSQQFSATAYDQFGQVISANLSWAVVNGGGNINQSGWFVADYQVGTYTNTVRVTASKNGISRSAYATVVINQLINQAVLDRVEITPSYANILINQQTDFNAQAYDINSTALYSGVTYYWSVISGPGSINQNGLFSAGSSTGTATVQVRANYGGVDRYALATVYISENGNYDDNEISYVRITPSVAYLNSGSAIDFDAQAYDYNSHAVSATYTWDLMSSIGTLDQNGYFVANTNNIGTYSDAVRVRAYRGGTERNDYADVVISSTNNNYGISATLSGSDENGGTAYENDVIVYTLQLTNNRNNTITNVNATFDIPTYTRFISVSSADGFPTISGSTVRWNLGTLYGSSTKTLTIRMVVKESVPGNAVIRGKAYVWASEVNGFWVYANDIYVAGTGATEGNGIPLTNTGTMDWIIAGAGSLIATILTKKLWLRSLL